MVIYSFLIFGVLDRVDGRRVPKSIAMEKEEEIIAALEATPDASRVARKLGVSFSTVWRRADLAGIELTAGRAATCLHAPTFALR